MFNRFWKRLAVTIAAVVIASHVVAGISYESNIDLIVASLLFGGVHAFLRSVLKVAFFLLRLVTLGLFPLVINAGLLLLTGAVVKGFHVAGFWPAFWGSLVISIGSRLLNFATGWGREEQEAKDKKDAWIPPKAARTKRPGMDDKGPVIDV